jgi:hypothetical protein
MTQPKTIKIDETEYVRADLAKETKPKEYDGMDYCIVRSREQGVMCGFVESINGRTVKLHQARQIWRYDSYFVLPDIAEKGMRDVSKCKLSAAMSQPAYMLEACGVLTCTEKAAEQLMKIKAEVEDD